MPTLDEIAALIPSGFHDDLITRLTYDLGQQLVVLQLSVDMDRPEQPDPSRRPASLTFHEARYLALDPPFEISVNQLWIITHEQFPLTEDASGHISCQPLSRYRFFTTYRTVEIAAVDVTFSWLAAETILVPSTGPETIC